MLERLQKIIANAGLASRRKAEELIQEGLVTVNGQVVTELGSKADPTQDHIKVNGKLINPLLENSAKVYLLLNKPKGYLSSLSDPQNRPLVTEFIPTGMPRVYPVGRLDFNTEGLLILTNDGDLTNVITKAGSHCPKVYHVKVKGSPTQEQLRRILRGMMIEGELYKIAKLGKLEITDAANTWFELTLHEGKNNQIRKMFDEIGHSVVKLRRVAIGHLTDEKLPIGMVRELTQKEVERFFQKARKTARQKATGKAPVETAPAAVEDLTARPQKLGKPKPQGIAKFKQKKRLTHTIGKDPASKYGKRPTTAKKRSIKRDGVKPQNSDISQ